MLNSKHLYWSALTLPRVTDLRTASAKTQADLPALVELPLSALMVQSYKSLTAALDQSDARDNLMNICRQRTSTEASLSKQH